MFSASVLQYITHKGSSFEPLGVWTWGLEEQGVVCWTGESLKALRDPEKALVNSWRHRFVSICAVCSRLKACVCCSAEQGGLERGRSR